MTVRTRPVLAALCVLLLAPAALAEKKVLRVGITAPPLSLDPAQALDSVTGLVCSQVYETPYAVAPGALVAEPRLFSTPLRSDGPAVRSAPIRAGALFSDGTPVTAAAVAASLSRVKALAEKASVKAEGERVVFTLKAPDELLETFLTQTFCGVSLEKGGRHLGSGPYMPSPSASLNAMVLVRNPSYPKPAPIEEIRFQVYRPTTDGSVAGLVNAVKRGDVDFTNAIPMSQVGEMKDAPGVVTSVTPGKSIGALYFNTEKGPLADPALRAAIAHAIDRAELARRFFGGDASFAAKSILPAAMAPAESDGLAYDPEKARQLVARSKAGAAGPVPLELLETWTARPYAPNPNGICRFVADALNKAGFRVKVVPSGGAESFFAKLDKGDFEAVLAGWIADSHEPIDFLEAQTASWSIPAAGGRCGSCNNIGRLRSRAVDAAIRAYHEKRNPGALATILRTVREEVPFFPLLNGPAVNAHTKRLKGFRPTPLALTSFAAFDLAD